MRLATPKSCFSLGFHAVGRYFRPALLAGTAALAGCDHSGPDPHLLGHVAALTGPRRDLGQQALRGVELAIDEANADSANLIAGRKLAVLHADSASNFKTAGAQAMRLATVNRVEALVGGSSQADAVAISVSAREFNLVDVNTAGVADSPPPIVFTVGLSEDLRAKAIDRFLAETLKPATVAVVSDGTDVTANRMADELARLGRARSSDMTRIQLLKDDDLPAAVEKLRGINGAVIVAAPAAQFLKLRELLVKNGALPNLIFAGDESERSEMAAKADQTFFVSAYAAGGGPKYEDFAKRFHAKFGVAPMPQAAASYDATRLLLAGARAAGGFSMAKLHDKLAEFKSFDGVMGSLSMGPDRVVRGPTFVVQIVAGKEELKQRFEP